MEVTPSLSEWNISPIVMTTNQQIADLREKQVSKWHKMFSIKFIIMYGHPPQSMLDSDSEQHFWSDGISFFVVIKEYHNPYHKRYSFIENFHLSSIMANKK